MSAKFEAGSYPYSGGFISSIGKYRERDSKWELLMVIILIDTIYQNSTEAAKGAHRDIKKTHAIAIESNGKVSIDLELSKIGYARLEEENING